MLMLAQAFATWESDIRPTVIAQYGEDDIPALSESWNDYTDQLCKDRELMDLQYHYCPAFDDEMPDDDREFILEQMGLRMTATRVDSRPDIHGDDRGDWDATASHWRVTLRRRGKRMQVFYSMGSAHKGSPQETDVIHSLLLDSESAEDTFEDWCANFGLDTDSRKAERTYRACRRIRTSLFRIFNGSELADLRELFEDM